MWERGYRHRDVDTPASSWHVTTMAKRKKKPERAGTPGPKKIPGPKPSWYAGLSPEGKAAFDEIDADPEDTHFGEGAVVVTPGPKSRVS